MGKKTGIIYKATNTITKKSYIGQTIKTINKRKGEHFRDAFYINGHSYDGHFQRAIRAYERNVWVWVIILDNIHIDNLNLWERFFIYFCDSFKNGYNSDTGGGAGKIVSEETKLKASKAKIGEKNPMSKLSNEGVQKIREMYLSGKQSQKEIAEIFMVHTNTICRIIHNGGRKDENYIPPDKKESKFTLQEVAEIRNLYATNKYSQRELAKIYDVKFTYMNNIINNIFYYDENYIVIKRQKFPLELRNKIIKRFKSENYSTKDLSGQFNISLGSVRYILNEANDDAIKAMLRKNMLTSTKGKHYSVSGETRKKMSQAMSREKHSQFGTHRSDKTKKKISLAHSGENGPMAKISNKDAQTIRRLYLSGKYIQRELSNKFGISISSISNIISNKTYRKA